jgi:type I restriction enzyme M protein
MDHETGPISKSDLARLLDIGRAAVTMWQRRYPDFPAPVKAGGAELFVLEQLAGWLASRPVPADVRRLDEPAGTTYADRLWRALSATQESAAAGPKVAERMAAELAWLGRELPPRSGYMDMVAALLFIRCRYPEQWAGLIDSVRGQAPVSGRPSFRTACHRALEALSVDHGGPGQPMMDESILTEGQSALADAVRLLDRLPTAGLDQASSPVARAIFSMLVDRIVTTEGRVAIDYVTPASVARLVVGLVGPIRAGARIHDPSCRTGELLALAVTHAAQANNAMNVVATGQHGNLRMLRLARMRLALLSMPAVATPGEGHWLGEVPARRGSVDAVITNPPFNSRDPAPLGDLRDHYGPPPRSNANFGWLQYAVSLLRDGGRAVVVMANNPSFSAHPRERHIRQAMVESGAVECLVSLPAGLFSGTGIATTLWVLRKPTGPADDVLFVDARKLGTMTSRTRRVLSDDDINMIVDTVTEGRKASERGGPHPGVEGWSMVATAEEIRDRDYSLSPPIYVGSPTGSQRGVADVRDVSALAVELGGLRSQAVDIDRRVDELLWRLGPWRR